jgi:hypothetical protein
MDTFPDPGGDDGHDSWQVVAVVLPAPRVRARRIAEHREMWFNGS